MLSRFLAVLLAAALAPHAFAQTTRVLLDIDRGPVLLELDNVRAPITTANFVRYVDDGAYHNTLIQRVARNFVVQGGGFRADAVPVTLRPAISSERNNGLRNVPGTIAMALSGNPPNVNSATSDWFINTGTNTMLDGDFTVFGRVVFGMRTLADINSTPVFPGTEQPVVFPVVKRAVRVASGEFPILPLHSGAWYDPMRTGTGFQVQVSHVAGSETGPLLVVSWYTFHEGRQIWLSGLAPFTWGTSTLEVPLQISSGGQFGSAFEPGQVTNDAAWGRLTLRFTGCSSGSFSYTSRYGNGTLAVQNLTLPSNERCSGN